ncbi:uncharacterized protein [Palaemon carinicauda]|uniref:uncharacterized protein n=1 Tax=Palaemon carinicauda TaxID=392227 RepID=UPI0035B62F53
MLGLYIILILDIDDERKSLVELKKLIYQLSYMDNCAIAFDSSAELEWAFKQVKGIFEPYQFRLQQFITNYSNLQEIIDSENEVKTDRNVKLLGLVWDREKDCLSTKPINLDIKANTKREVLHTTASQYDLYNFNGLLLNRSRLFLHILQCDQQLSWDQALDKERSREWQNIAKQASAAPVIKVPRFAGSRDDTYKLIAYSDSSKCIFGVVIYIQCISTGKLSFAFAKKNRMVGKNLQYKSMLSLELQSFALAVECLLDLYQEFLGPSCIKPIKIQELRVYSDSLVALSWIYSYTHNLDNLQKCSVFVKNRLHEISELCLKQPDLFSFVSGEENPRDCITRSLSYRSLMKTNYLTGPDLVNAPRMEHSKDTLEFVVPDPKMDIQIPVNSLGAYISSKDKEIEHFQMTSIVSGFHRLILINRNVLLFVNKLKIKVMARDPNKFNHLKAFHFFFFFAEASRLLLSRDQGCYFAEELEYFNSSERLLKDVPRILGQLNIYIDKEGLLRVRSKLSRLKDEGRYRFPILLSKDSTLTKLIIRDYHERFAHEGVYSVLSEMRKMFWVSKSFSTVKKVLKSFVVCRRFNERAIKLNQNSY